MERTTSLRIPFRKVLKKSMRNRILRICVYSCMLSLSFSPKTVLAQGSLREKWPRSVSQKCAAAAIFGSLVPCCIIADTAEITMHITSNTISRPQWGNFEFSAHLNRDKIESNLSVPGIQGHQENALIKSFDMSSHLICL